MYNIRRPQRSTKKDGGIIPMATVAYLIVFTIIFALAATVLAFIFIVPDKKRARLNKLGQFAHDVMNFKFLIIEKILQALYIFSTAFVILLGFFMLFYFQEQYSYFSGSHTVWYGGYGLLVMILGPIVVRLGYEFMMMAILLVKNVIQINNKLKNQNEGESADIFAVPEIELPKKPEKQFCPQCGAEATDAAYCPKCGNKM